MAIEEFDKIRYKGNEYFVIEVKRNIVRARRVFDGGSVGRNVVSIPKSQAKIIEKFR